MIVHRLQWSMSYGRPVRVTRRDGSVKTGRVVRTWTEQHPKPLPRGASSVGAVFEDGTELRVDAIERVQLPVGDAGAAFVDE